ncbi:MAG: hypothetical protein KDD48_03330 [Bdellovibrionales bacterium]|nr:hypothetical protein [Bdellovibrionales bacterium]
MFLSHSSWSEPFEVANPAQSLVFPRDHGEHRSFKTEWWYYTGHLLTEDGRRFGYQLTFFRNALGNKVHVSDRKSKWATNQLYFTHFAISDSQEKKHHFAERFSRGMKPLAFIQTQPFQLVLEDWLVSGSTPGTANLSAKAPKFEINLQLQPKKDLMLQGSNGFSQKGFNRKNSSHYYSYSRLYTTGQIKIGDQKFNVTGQSWMDHEYSTSLLEKSQRGWDWFAIQLNNQSELMLFQLRDQRGSYYYYRVGKLNDKGGNSKTLDMSGAEFVPISYFKSEKSGGQYPIKWKVTIPKENIDLTVTAIFENQEMMTSVVYWEGATDISGQINKGQVKGMGYLEMTGYAENISKRFE